MRIEICGGIAAGKTTLTRVLNERAGYAPIFEDFKRNPFWEAFYADPGSHAFETEITFLLMHFHQLKASLVSSQGAVSVSDFSITLDVAYADLGLFNGSRMAFDAVAAEVQRQLGEPDLLIHLRCDPTIELERIRARGREQEASISLEFLAALDTAVVERVNDMRRKTTILVVDSSKSNFADFAVEAAWVTNLIQAAVRSHASSSTLPAA